MLLERFAPGRSVDMTLRPFYISLQKGGFLMYPHYAFAGRTRVLKVKGGRRGRRGLVVEVDLRAGVWTVLFDDTKLAEPRQNPYEFDVDRGQDVDSVEKKTP